LSKSVLHIVFIFSFLSAFAQQNLVPNGSFEDTVFCPFGSAQPNSVAVWYNVTSASPDYYNACSSLGAGVPDNDWGFQYAEDGQAYIGLITYWSSQPEYREYMQVKLNTPLVKDKYYCWSMWVSLLDSVDFASNNIGIALSNNAVTAFGSQVLLPISLYGNESNIQTDANNWVKIGGNFKANGNEEFLTIGNFLPDVLTSSTQLHQNTVGGEGAYYYIDNVFLGDCIVNIEFPNVFTPNKNGSNDIYSISPLGIEQIDFRVLNRWGESVCHSLDKISWDGTLNGIECNDGVYYYVCTYHNTETNVKETKTGFIQLIR